MNVNEKTAKRIGIGLILAGLIGAGITAFEMTQVYRTSGGEPPPALAEDLNATLMPATIGAGLALVGVIMIVVTWWRNRKPGPTKRFRAA